MTEDIVYFCEHDVLYHPSHFEFTPPEKDKFYYNGNYWHVRLTDGFAIHYNVSPLSGLVAYREALLTHFRERMEYIKENGFSLRVGFEPFTHNRIKWNTWYDYELFMPEYPNIDVCHEGNSTWKRFDQKNFRKKPTFWEESTIDNIPGWPDLAKLLRFNPEEKAESKPEDKPKGNPKGADGDTLSILIPARNEMFLGITVQNLLDNIEGNTNIIVVLDGYTTEIPDIPEDPRVIIIKHHDSIGQREATNEACKLSKAKYVAKTDAHCSFDKGFDVKLMARMKDEYTMVPVMRNLWAFDWECVKCGATKYQGPTPTECWEKDCDSKEFRKDMKWVGKTNPQSTSYCFDSEPHFQYFKEFKDRDEYKKDLETGLTETMSLQGSFWMLTWEKYWDLNISDDEAFGSWGSQGIEVAVKTWLSGGKVVCNHDTWYAHMFRTQGGDFGFPYALSGKQVSKAKKKAKEIFFNNNYPNQKLPLKWLLKKFWPVPGWTEEELNSLPDGLD